MLSAVLKSLSVYEAGEQPQDRDFIKLNTNENPYPPSKKVDRVLRKINYQKLNLYPDPDSNRLTEELARYHKVAKENIFVGNGSDEVLAFCFYSFFKQDEPLLFPNITYSFYKTYASFFDIDYKTISLDKKFNIDFSKFLQQKSGGIIFANPNAPTGIYENIARIKKLLQSYQEKVVVIDEAYIDFGGESCISLLGQYPNLVIVRTFSKARSLAGIRVGYVMASSFLINALNRVKNSFNSYPIGTIASKIAICSLRDDEYFNKTIKKIIKNRLYLCEKLKELNFKILPSFTNFVFVTCKDFSAQVLYKKLKEKKVLVRYFADDNIDNFLRITVGTKSQIKRLIENLRNILSNP
jgi:histidinol-phosphate aminotransferase